MTTYNFSVNYLDFGNYEVDFGNYEADTQAQAQELFAVDAGYKRWSAMCDHEEEFCGNTIEVREVLETGQLQSVEAV
jgi:hypothetical protein